MQDAGYQEHSTGWTPIAKKDEGFESSADAVEATSGTRMTSPRRPPHTSR